MFCLKELLLVSKNNNQHTLIYGCLCLKVFHQWGRGRGTERKTERQMENFHVFVLCSSVTSRSDIGEASGITAELCCTFVHYKLVTSIFWILDNPLFSPLAMI